MNYHRGQIIKQLDRLILAFPRPELSKETIALYADHLEDLSLYGIREAVEHHIRHSKWFPRISELREAGLRFVGYEPLYPIFSLDVLIKKFWALEDALYHKGEFDLEAWNQLIKEFEAEDRICRAESIRRKLPDYQEIHAELMALDELGEEENQSEQEEDQREPEEKIPELRGALEY